jgi:hypothetical protein
MDNSIIQHNVFKQGIKEFQINKYKQLENYYLAETLKLSFFTSPLLCISENMQYLNKEIHNKNNEFLKTSMHRNKFSILNPFSSVFPKTESVIFPFKPSFYKNYRECFINLRRQGILGFYKGNFYRLLFFIYTDKFKQQLDLQVFKVYKDFYKINKFLRNIVLYSFADIILNPLLFIESRYTVQNRLKGFRIYNNILDVVRYSWKEIYRGCSFSIPKNTLFVLGTYSHKLLPEGKNFQYLSVALAHLLSYPILTVQRNYIYQSFYQIYFPKDTYSKSYLKFFLSNFGFQNLYRGFFPYSVAIFSWHLVVPNAAKHKFYRNIFEKDKDNSNLLEMNFFEEDEN